MKAYRDDLRGAGAAGLADRLQRVVACLLCGFVSATGAACAFGEVTPGWENVCPDRSEFPTTEAVWRADPSARGEFRVELRGGAKGRVSFGADGIRISKTNGAGAIVVIAKPFAVAKGQRIRFSADQTSDASDVDYSNGFLRYFGRMSVRVDGLKEGNVTW